ncbi:hypothetical protein UCREL1_10827 [Eutypa lata UCREL1]|uniref:Uncharacterized protein n=1 Tax=Eutypa lata (strain UCR-EL1) TaxID=1287681 RepID=M7S808_EUTLA|nr:hypothetical protein UCREL1_10827 [Eutypa lata UCREL1]
MAGVIAGFDDKGESRDLVMKGADDNGEPKRPSYRTAQDQSRDEINWGRWVRQPVADPNKDYPQKDVMGSWDFNKPRWIPEQELEPRAGLGDGITQAALQEKTARQPAPAPLSDASKDAIQGMNPSGTIPYISKAKHKVGQREAAYESLRMLAEGAPKSEVKLNCRARRELKRQQQREAAGAAAAEEEAGPSTK